MCRLTMAKAGEGTSLCTPHETGTRADVRGSFGTLTGIRATAEASQGLYSTRLQGVSA